MYDVIVVTYGGAGSTMLLKFLANFIAVNSWNSRVDGIKHANSPEHPILVPANIKKAVYLISDPREAVVSLFRRGYASQMEIKLNALYDSVESYNALINTASPQIKFENYLAQGRDALGLINHWNAWHSCRAPWPILYIKYDNLYSNLKTLFDFIGLSNDLLKYFPPFKARESTIDRLPLQYVNRLDAIYAPLTQRINSVPDVYLREL